RISARAVSVAWTLDLVWPSRSSSSSAASSGGISVRLSLPAKSRCTNVGFAECSVTVGPWSGSGWACCAAAAAVRARAAMGMSRRMGAAPEGHPLLGRTRRGRTDCGRGTLGAKETGMQMDPERASVARAIADVALLRGTFTLRSGRTSSYYLDKYLFSTRPEVLGRLGKLFAERIRQMQPGVDRLAGAELGGIPLVTVASLQTGLPCVFVRNKKKDYGTAKQLEGVLRPGDRLVIVEDVATTGGQALEAA